MKRENRLRNKIVQFGYEHRGLELEFGRVQKSAMEVGKMLDGMVPKVQKETKNKEN